MADILTKVQRLIALTASSNENEARNAAFMACKLIREHKLEVRLGGMQPAPRVMPTQAATPTPKAKRPTWVDIKFDFGDGNSFDFESISWDGVPFPPSKRSTAQVYHCAECTKRCPDVWERNGRAVCSPCKDAIDEAAELKAREVRKQVTNTEDVKHWVTTGQVPGWVKGG